MGENLSMHGWGLRTSTSCSGLVVGLLKKSGVRVVIGEESGRGEREYGVLDAYTTIHLTRFVSFFSAEFSIMLALARSLRGFSSSATPRVLPHSLQKTVSASASSRPNFQRIPKDEEWKTMQWFLHLAAQHAPGFEFRALPKNSQFQLLMSMRSSSIVPDSQKEKTTFEDVDRLWTPMIVKTCTRATASPAGSTRYRYRFNGMKRVSSDILHSATLLKACKPDGFFWLIPPSRPRGSGCVQVMHPEIHCPEDVIKCSEDSFGHRFQSQLQHCFSTSMSFGGAKSFLDWIVASSPTNLDSTYGRGRELQRQLLTIPTFRTLDYVLRHNETANATLLGKNVLVRTCTFFPRKSGGGHLDLTACTFGGRSRPLKRDSVFDYLIVLFSANAASHDLQKLCILSKTQLYHLEYLADPDAGLPGRQNIYFTKDNCVTVKGNRISLSDFFIDATAPTCEMEDFLRRNMG